MKGITHYRIDGTPYEGETHAMPGGVLHTGASHDASSGRVYHFQELSPEAKRNAMMLMVEANKKR